MDFLSITFSVCVLCIIFILSLRYLSILRWFSGQAYVLSKKQESFSILEVLELFKNSKPFPVSYQKGWKIHSFVHGHRVWFHFLTFTRVPSSTPNGGHMSTSGASSAPCIKVFASFDRVRASSQSLLQLVKDTSLSCEWKPGVIAARSVHEVPASEVNGKNKGMVSLPVLTDFVRVERVAPARHRWWRHNHSSNIVTPTVIEDYKRYWHREENGCSWLLQMNEEAQSLVFFLIQPVEDPDHSLLTVVTWSAPHTSPATPVDEAPSILLSSLSDYIHLRRVQMTPLLNISLPHHMVASGGASSRANKTASSPQSDSLMSRFRQFVQKSGNTGADSTAFSDSIRKSASILHYRSATTGGLLSKAGISSHHSQVIQEEENESDGDSVDPDPAGGDHTKVIGGVDGAGDEAGERRKGELRRSMSEVVSRHSPSPQLSGSDNDAADKTVSRYRTLVNQAAADVMAEAIRASNIDLETAPSVQAEVSSGWTYIGFENNIVTLKKIPPAGSTVQSYIGKGFILAPPKTVWDAIRNPRTRFTYDDTLKKVDVVEQVTQGIKIVYLYQEVLQLLRKECCDVCCLQGERVEGSKFVLSYTSVDHPKVPPVEGVIRGKMLSSGWIVEPVRKEKRLYSLMLSSGWIVEPVRKEKRLYSLVTYLMQMDYGQNKTGPGLPLDDMMSRHPMSINYLQQYLKPAVQLARRKSAPVIQF